MAFLKNCGLICCLSGASLLGIQPMFAQACRTPRYLLERDVKRSVAIVRALPGNSGTLRPSRGLGFFVSEQNKIGVSGRSRVWFVTARHLLQEQHFDGSLGAYLNEIRIEVGTPPGDSRAGVSYAVLPVAGRNGQPLWITPSDNALDVALIPVEFAPSWNHVTCIDVQQFLTTSLLEHEMVGSRDDVVFLNAFASGPKRRVQRVLVQHGQIVDFSRNTLSLQKGGGAEISARPYLGHVNSFGTNAGAPVFVKLAVFEKTTKKGTYRANYSFYLAGALESYLLKTAKGSYIAQDYSAHSTATGYSLVAIAPAEEILKLMAQSAEVLPVKIGRERRKE